LSFLTQKQINEIAIIALKAGKIAKDFFVKKNFTIEKKLDQSDVTSADIAVSDFICESLTEVAPNIPIICEEKNKITITGNVFFLIDPIDGTSGYANGKDEFSVNISLIKDKKPIFGLIYAPIFENGKMFYNEKNKILKYDNLLDKDLHFVSDNDLSRLKPKYISKPAISKNIALITSQRSHNSDIENFIKQFYPQNTKNKTIKKTSSAVKFFDLLQGKSNIYAHFNQTMEWDTAAGQALVELIGFKVKEIDRLNNKFVLKNILEYTKENYINPSFVIS